jgi:hypothetical protein
MLVINQPEAVSNIAVPILDTKLTVHMTVKAKWLKGPQRDGAGSAGVKAIVTERTQWAPICVLAREMHALPVRSPRKFDGQSNTVRPNPAIRCQRSSDPTLEGAFSQTRSETNCTGDVPRLQLLPRGAPPGHKNPGELLSVDDPSH